VARRPNAIARHSLGTIEAPDPDAAEAEAVKLFGLSEDQRKRLLVMWERE
jgi:hypothetical protein